MMAHSEEKAGGLGRSVCRELLRQKRISCSIDVDLRSNRKGLFGLICRLLLSKLAFPRRHSVVFRQQNQWNRWTNPMESFNKINGIVQQNQWNRFAKLTLSVFTFDGFLFVFHQSLHIIIVVLRVKNEDNGRVGPQKQRVQFLAPFNWLRTSITDYCCPLKTSPFISYTLIHQSFGRKAEYGSDNELDE